MSRALAAATLVLASSAGCSRETDPSSAHAQVVEIATAGLPGGWLALPSRPDSVKFAVIGDSGRGWAPQHEVARQMAAYREHFPFAFVLMAGDNIYEGPATPEDYRVKFEEPMRRCSAPASASTPCSATTTIRSSGTTRRSTCTATATTRSRRRPRSWPAW